MAITIDIIIHQRIVVCINRRDDGDCKRNGHIGVYWYL